VNQQEALENYMMRSFMICTSHVVFTRIMQLRRITWAGHMTCLGEKISVYKVLV
jgi:hypothetical protein